MSPGSRDAGVQDSSPSSASAWLARLLLFEQHGLPRRPCAAATFQPEWNGIAPSLHADYERQLAAGIKPNLARLTLARRIASTVLAMWKNKEDYDPAKQRPQTAA
jgi:hypothetical protein